MEVRWENATYRNWQASFPEQSQSLPLGSGEKRVQRLCEETEPQTDQHSNINAERASGMNKMLQESECLEEDLRLVWVLAKNSYRWEFWATPYRMCSKKGHNGKSLECVESKIVWRPAYGSMVHQGLNLLVCVGEGKRWGGKARLLQITGVLYSMLASLDLTLCAMKRVFSHGKT